jgi:predicted aldo/keto reductase-like oxidoreductase
VEEFHKILSGEFVDYVRELKLEGKIRHIGLSTHNPNVAKLAALSGEIEMILFSLNPAFDMLPASEDINLLFSEHYNDELKGIAPEREELYQICERENVGITVMKAYGGGRLFSAEHSPFGVALTPVQCLHYALTRPAVAAVMVGFRTPEHVDAAVAYEVATEEQKDYASVLANAPYHAYSGQCTYCGHCAPCPSYIDIAMVNKLYDLAIMQEDIPATIFAHYTGLSANASDCISCKACEKRCPFGVSISDRMKKASQLFHH